MCADPTELRQGREHRVALAQSTRAHQTSSKVVVYSVACRFFRDLVDLALIKPLENCRPVLDDPCS
jgi:hypothetical protein